MDYIKSVKQAENGYIINSTMFVQPHSRRVQDIRDWIAEGGAVEPIPEPTYEELTEEIRQQRESAFSRESDPVFLKTLTDGGSLEAAQAAAAPIKEEIREKFPYPEEV